MKRMEPELSFEDLAPLLSSLEPAPRRPAPEPTRPTTPPSADASAQTTAEELLLSPALTGPAGVRKSKTSASRASLLRVNSKLLGENVELTNKLTAARATVEEIAQSREEVECDSTKEREFLLGYIRNLTKGMSHAEAERHREDQVVVAECREALVKAHKEMEMQQAELLDVQRQVKAHAERSAQAAVAAEGLQALRDTALRSSEMAKAAAQSQGERLRGELDETREILRESMDREKSLKERLRAATREAGEVRSLAMRASRDTNHARRETTAARQKLRRLGKTMASDEAMAAVSAARARVKQGEVLAKQLKQQSEESRREVEEIRKEAAQTSRCLAEAKFEAAAKEAEANLRLSEQVTLARATEQRLREELANAALALDAERCQHSMEIQQLRSATELKRAQKKKPREPPQPVMVKTPQPNPNAVEVKASWDSAPVGDRRGLRSGGKASLLRSTRESAERVDLRGPRVVMQAKSPWGDHWSIQSAR